MAQPYLHASTLMIVTLMTPQVNILVLSWNPRGYPRPYLRSLLTLIDIKLWPQALPQTTTPIILKTLDLPQAGLKSTHKSNHKSRPRYLPSSSEEYQSSELRHRSPKPSRKIYPDQDHPQHDPDPPFYREVALTDIPSQYAEEAYPQTSRP